MKTRRLLFLAAALCATALVHATQIVGGPQGGRLLETEPVRAEFVVNAERKAEIRFYDAALKPVAPAAQDVTLTIEAPTGRLKLAVVKTEFGFATSDALPAGDPYRVVVQVRATPEAKPQNFRIDVNLGHCAGCDRAEYACTCESH